MKIKQRRKSSLLLKYPLRVEARSPPQTVDEQKAWRPPTSNDIICEEGGSRRISEGVILAKQVKGCGELVPTRTNEAPRTTPKIRTQ